MDRCVLTVAMWTQATFRDLVSSLPPCLTCHGWPLVPSAWYELSGLFLALPRVYPTVAWSDADAACPVHLFIDGTCACPSEPLLRYASWGVTQALFTPSQLDHRVFSCGHVCGQLQSAYRGELEAMVFALKMVAKNQVTAIIWSDCAAVIRRTNRMLRGEDVKDNSPHADLWKEIAELVSEGLLGSVTLQKVLSRGDFSRACNGIEYWAFWRNSLVDAAVGRFNLKRPAAFFQVWQKVFDSLALHRALHADYVGVLYYGRHAMEVAKPQVDDAEDEYVEEPVDNGPVLCPSGGWRVDEKLSRKYGATNVDALHGWWRHSALTGGASREPLRWISAFQLYGDF